MSIVTKDVEHITVFFLFFVGNIMSTVTKILIITVFLFLIKVTLTLGPLKYNPIKDIHKYFLNTMFCCIMLTVTKKLLV